MYTVDQTKKHMSTFFSKTRHVWSDTRENKNPHFPSSGLRASIMSHARNLKQLSIGTTCVIKKKKNHEDNIQLGIGRYTECKSHQF